MHDPVRELLRAEQLRVPSEPPATLNDNGGEVTDYKVPAGFYKRNIPNVALSPDTTLAIQYPDHPGKDNYDGV